MFGRKKEKPKRNHSGKNLSQYGLFDIPTNFDTGLGNVPDDDDGDSDLEAELAALSGSGGSSKPKKPAKKIIPQGELDAMVADSLKDAPSDEELSVDENDPELLGELGELTGDAEEETKAFIEETPSSISSDVITVLAERLKNYEIAEKEAKSAGESSKARRYGRAIKTLKDLLKQAKSGKNVNVNDDSVPPEIHLGAKKSPASNNAQSEDASVSVPSRPAPQIPVSPPTERTPLPETVQEQVEEKKQEIDQELLNMLTERQKEYKIAALKCKKSDDPQSAMKYVKIARQFDAVIAAVQSGQAVDLSKMPGPPGESTSPPEPKREESESQKNTIPEIPIPETENLPEEALITASTVLEALEQRLAVYKEQEAQAKEQGNSSKARRHGRIVKQYEQAIKLHKAGKPVPVDELPTPPGYGPIPVEGGGQAPAPKPASSIPKEVPRQPTAGTSEEEESKKSPGSRISGNHVTTTHADKQVLILLAKQKQFKQAALNAKKQGEIAEAKEFLRQAKGFDKLLEAARAGLPVDWSSIPVSPEAKSQLDNEYDIVMTEECSEDSTTDSDIISRLENQLQKQLKMCLTTRDHNKALGDVAGTNRFERLALNVTKDLDIIRLVKRTPGAKVPKFHYEMKEFSIVKSFTELMDNDMELAILRGINYQSTNPKEIDTYVKFEFPFPQEEPYTDKTSTVKDTNNPEYNQTFTIPIQRSSRQCQRVFKRHGIKFEVYSKGGCAGASDIFCCSGFFRGDTLIGTINLKLQPLETQCELHDSFDLLEGRKKVGGKLEVRIRLRNPIVTQQVEQVQEKWLIIDQ